MALGRNGVQKGEKIHGICSFPDCRKRLKTETPKSALVLWKDAEIGRYISKALPKLPLEYTVEINPPTEAPLKSYLYYEIPEMSNFPTGDCKSLLNRQKSASFASSATDEEFGLELASEYKYSTRFDALEDIEYTISISTELDGITIAQTTMTIGNGNSSNPGSPTGSKKEK